MGFSLLLQLVVALLTAGRRRRQVSAVMALLLLIACVVFFRIREPLISDTDNSLLLYFIFLTAAGLIVFMLGQSRPGACILFLSGNLICAGAQFLQYPAPLWTQLLFDAAALLLFLLRVYLHSVARADVPGGDIPRYLRQTLTLCLIAAVAACGIYYGAVRPLSPPTMELKLITILRSMELLQVMGVASTQIVFDPALASAEQPQQQDTAGLAGDERSETLLGQNQQSERLNGAGQQIQQLTSRLQEQWSAIRYDEERRFPLWLLFLPLLLTAACLLRIWRKKRWHDWLQTLPRETAVVNYYRFFLRDIARAGLPKPPAVSLLEYVTLYDDRLRPFAPDDGSFSRMTAICQKVIYGRQPVSEDEYACFERFYAGFYRALRRELGTLKYYLSLFRY
ncbi:MAG: DUF4129 domain-containing protein [Bacillota bacterium]|nr:DUF4129 domain-containing protein [Bacillota bacterium]